MATELEDPKSQSTASLVGGIVDDMQHLVKQQVQLTRKEITEEVHKASQAAQFFAMGGAILFLGILVLCLSAAYLIHWMSLPAGITEPARIPLWAAHAAVGAPLTILGSVLAWMGREKLQSIHPLHNPATEAMKDNVKWATNSK